MGERYGFEPINALKVITGSAQAGRPTNEDYWRARLGAQGSLSPQKQRLGEKIESGVASALERSGVTPRYANHLAKRTVGALNDLTPVGNVTGADQGAREFYNGLTRGDLAQMLLGAGVFSLSAVPFGAAKKATEPLRKEYQNLLNDSAGAIRAWHGSPHDFDRFDMSKMGVGEGNQAYGRGLYFAENPRVAGSYVQPRGAEPLDVPPEVTDRLRELLKADDYLGFDTFGQAIHAIRSSPLDFDKAWEVTDAPAIREALAAYDAAKWPQGQRPRLYETSINAEPEQFYDLDAGPRISEAEAQRRGFKGFRYLDQGSRQAGGTSNYVVFDDSLIDILNKF